MINQEWLPPKRSFRDNDFLQKNITKGINKEFRAADRDASIEYNKGVQKTDESKKISQN